ncbi:MAG: hypothetical protein K5911_07500 [Eubacteriales bacterium]|nr:hypothetical protein [Eubacteriales bacterium]
MTYEPIVDGFSSVPLVFEDALEFTEYVSEIFPEASFTLQDNVNISMDFDCIKTIDQTFSKTAGNTFYRLNIYTDGSVSLYTETDYPEKDNVSRASRVFSVHYAANGSFIPSYLYLTVYYNYNGSGVKPTITSAFASASYANVKSQGYSTYNAYATANGYYEYDDPYLVIPLNIEYIGLGLDVDAVANSSLFSCDEYIGPIY